jgi:hypothetical protein
LAQSHYHLIQSQTIFIFIAESSFSIAQALLWESMGQAYESTSQKAAFPI